jgi:hypothetical protein
MSTQPPPGMIPIANRPPPGMIPVSAPPAGMIPIEAQPVELSPLSRAPAQPGQSGLARIKEKMAPLFQQSPGGPNRPMDFLTDITGKPITSPEDISIGEVRAYQETSPKEINVGGPSSRAMVPTPMTLDQARQELWDKKYDPALRAAAIPIGGPVEAAVTGGAAGLKMGLGAGKVAAMAAMDAVTAPVFDEAIDTNPLPGSVALLAYGAIQPALIERFTAPLRKVPAAAEKLAAGVGTKASTEATDIGAAIAEHQNDLSRLVKIEHDPKMGIKARIYNWYGDQQAGVVAGHKVIRRLREAAKAAGWTAEDAANAVQRIEAGEHTPLLDAIRKVHNDWADTWNQFKDSDMPTIQNYVRHMWQKPDSMVKRGDADPHYFYGMRAKAEAKAWAAQNGGEVLTADNWSANVAGRLRQQPSFVKKRVMATETRGLEMGLRPSVDNIFDRMEHYNAMMHTVMANNRMAQDVGKMLTAEGQPVVVRWSEAAGNHFKPRGYVEVDAPALGRFARGKGDISRVLVHPDYVRPIRSVFTGENTNAFGNAYDNLAAVSKASLLSLSMFHAMALTESAVMDLGYIRGTAVAAKGLSRMAKGLLWKEVGTTVKRSAMAEDAIRHGLQMGTPTLVQRQRADAAINALEKKVFGAVGKKWMPITHLKERWDQSLWEIYHDALKLSAYEKHVAQWAPKMAKRFGMSIDDAKMKIAESTNDAFGGQIWDVAGNVMQDPNFRKWAHRIFLAPDWNYSQGKIFLRWLKAAKPGKTPEEWLDAKLANRYWLRALILVGGLFQAVNYHNTKRDYGKGYFTWENPGRREGLTPVPGVGPLAKVGDIYLGKAVDPDTLRPVEQYFRPIKQIFEPLDFVANPLDFIERKAHPTWKALLKASMPGFRDEWTQRKMEEAAGDPAKYVKTWLESVVGQQFVPIGIGAASKPGTQLYGGIYRITKGITYNEAQKRANKIVNTYANAMERYNNPLASPASRYAAAQALVGLAQKDMPSLELTMQLNGLDPGRLFSKEMKGAMRSRAFQTMREQNREAYQQTQ